MLKDKLVLDYIIDKLCEKSDNLKAASSFPNFIGGSRKSILHARNEAEILDKVIGALQEACEFYFPKRK